MDRSVYLIFALLILLSLSVLGFRAVTSDACEEPVFELPASIIAGERVELAYSGKGVKTVEWDFGDGSAFSTESKVSHRFDKTGTFVVRLLINGKCASLKQLLVKDKPSVNVALAQIQGPTSSVKVGEMVRFSELTPAATSWEWTFGESGKVDSREKTPAYAFQTAGYKTVTVYASGKDFRYTGTYTVNVREKDAPAPVIVEEGPKGPTGMQKKLAFTNAFTEFLTNTDVPTRTAKMNEAISYTCSSEIMVNKGKQSIVFKAFCTDLLNRNKVAKVKGMAVSFDDAGDCVKGVVLDYKEK